MKAALQVAGINVKELAARIDRRGYGEKSLYLMTSGEKTIRAHDCDVVAAACEVDPSFFTVDFTRPLANSDSTQLREINDALEAVNEGLAAIQTVVPFAQNVAVLSHVVSELISERPADDHLRKLAGQLDLDVDPESMASGFEQAASNEPPAPGETAG